MDVKTEDRLMIAIKASRNAFLAVGFFSAFINALMLTVPIYVLQLYDRVLTSRSVDTLIMLSLVAVGLMLMMALLQAVRTRVLTRLSVRFDRQLGLDVFSAAVARRLRSTDDTMDDPLRDLATLRGFLTGPGLQALFDSPWTPAFILVIYLLHPILGVIALSGAVTLLFLTVIGELLTRKRLLSSSIANTKANRLADISAPKAEAIEAMGMLSSIGSRWYAMNEERLAHQVTASSRSDLISAMTKFLRPTLQIGILGSGAYLALQGTILPGAIIAASIILSRALAPVEGVIAGWRGSVAARSAYNRLKHLLNSDQTLGEQTLTLPPPIGQLQVEALMGASPGVKKPFLQRIDFALEPGSSLAVIGPSGAGKSMLARILVGIWSPLHGSVSLDGAKLAQWRGDKKGDHIGYLPQDMELFEGTIAENIARLGEVDDHMVITAAHKAGIHDVITNLPDGYNTWIGERGYKLSGGQRQSVGLARAFYRSPALVVLDEPTTYLDSRGEKALQSMIASMKLEKKTLVLITNRPEFLTTVDRILVLDKGRMAALGPPADILNRFTQPAMRPTRLVSVKSEGLWPIKAEF